MAALDLNALADLDALLRESGVAAAARRLNISAPAMSRRLGRLRERLGDPLFVLAGRRLVPTARALALQPRVEALLEDARAALSPPVADLQTLKRTLAIRANDGFYMQWAAELVARVATEAPRMRLRLSLRADKNVEALRSGDVDLDIGVLGRAGPEIKTQKLFEAAFVGVVRADHPLAQMKRVDAADFVRFSHISSSRRGRATGLIDDALKSRGFERNVSVVVPGFAAALAIAAQSDLIAAIPAPFARWAANAMNVHVFDLPVRTPTTTVTMAWHPRHDADPAHQMLRAAVRKTVKSLG